MAGAVLKLSVKPAGGWRYDVNTGAAQDAVAIKAMDGETVAPYGRRPRRLTLIYRDDGRTIWLADADPLAGTRQSCRLRPPEEGQRAGQGLLLAPMHGRLAGDQRRGRRDQVKKGDRLAVLEAMKMQHELTAGIDGRVKRIAATPGVQIAARDLILEIEPLPASGAGVPP